MKIKIADLNETQLKDYLIASAYMKDMPPDKLELTLNKYKKAGDAGEREGIQKILTEAHLKMVVYIANRYRGAGLSFAKLIKEGNLGLIDAVKKWEGPENGDFVPYLVWNIEGAVIEALIRNKKSVKEENYHGQK